MCFIRARGCRGGRFCALPVKVTSDEAPHPNHRASAHPCSRPSGHDLTRHCYGEATRLVFGLMLTFVPEPEAAVASMMERISPGGVIGAYVWDYAEGMMFLRHFWDEAVAMDPSTIEMDEGRRFPLCRPEPLAAVFEGAGRLEVETLALEIQTGFRDFDDYWRPFLGGPGPAPGLVQSLDEDGRKKLRDRLRRRLPATEDGVIKLRARAWAVRGFAPRPDFGLRHSGSGDRYWPRARF
jgi:hypothetical protein